MSAQVNNKIDIIRFLLLPALRAGQTLRECLRQNLCSLVIDTSTTKQRCCCWAGQWLLSRYRVQVTQGIPGGTQLKLSLGSRELRLEEKFTVHQSLLPDEEQMYKASGSGTAAGQPCGSAWPELSAGRWAHRTYLAPEVARTQSVAPVKA